MLSELRHYYDGWFTNGTVIRLTKPNEYTYIDPGCTVAWSRGQYLINGKPHKLVALYHSLSNVTRVCCEVDVTFVWVTLLKSGIFVITILFSIVRYNVMPVTHDPTSWMKAIGWDQLFGKSCPTVVCHNMRFLSYDVG